MDKLMGFPRDPQETIDFPATFRGFSSFQAVNSPVPCCQKAQKVFAKKYLEQLGPLCGQSVSRPQWQHPGWWMIQGLNYVKLTYPSDIRGYQ